MAPCSDVMNLIDEFMALVVAKNLESRRKPTILRLIFQDPYNSAAS
jgi:hypothetical protein